MRDRRGVVDWVETFEGWDDSDTEPQVNMAANDEVWFPLVNTYIAWGLNSEDATSPPGTYTRGLPWGRRRCLRVRGWVHTSSPTYFTGNNEMLCTMQLERAQTDPLTGVVIPPSAITSTRPAMQDVTTYGKWQHYLIHYSGWTSPDDFTTFKKSFFIDKRLNVVLNELEVLALRITWRTFATAPRLFVRPFLRTLVATG